MPIDLPTKPAVAMAALLILAAGLATAWWIRSGHPVAADGKGRKALAAWLKQTEQSFALEMPARPLAFPEDHGAHPEAPLETWEFSGTLATPDGRAFGIQWSLLRLGLRPNPPQRQSAWATAAVYRGLFAVTDPTDGEFHWFERFSRAALGLAGSETRPVRVWLGNWSMAVPADAGAQPMFEIGAASGGIHLQLRLSNLKPAVLPEDEGSSEPTARMRTYALSRLHADGTVTIGEVPHTVSGPVWLSRIWGRIPLPGGQTAVNRFRFQLDDGRELAVFQMHRRDGSAEPINSGYWVDREGHRKPIRRDSLTLDPAGYWQAPESGARYPVRWTVRLPEDSMELDVLPLLENQEIRASQRAWSGAVSVRGKGPEPVSGTGFAELDGY